MWHPFNERVVHSFRFPMLPGWVESETLQAVIIDQVEAPLDRENLVAAIFDQ